MQNLPTPDAEVPDKAGEEALIRSVDKAVPLAERLPTAADENPISERVREAGDEPLPPPDDLTVQGGERVEP